MSRGARRCGLQQLGCIANIRLPSALPRSSPPPRGAGASGLLLLRPRPFFFRLLSFPLSGLGGLGWVGWAPLTRSASHTATTVSGSPPPPPPARARPPPPPPAAAQRGTLHTWAPHAAVLSPLRSSRHAAVMFASSGYLSHTASRRCHHPSTIWTPRTLAHPLRRRCTLRPRALRTAAGGTAPLPRHAPRSFPPASPPCSGGWVRGTGRAT